MSQNVWQGLGRGLIDWRIFYDAPRGTVVLLHPSGLWTEADADAARNMPGNVADVCDLALSAVVAAGRTGRVDVVTDTSGPHPRAWVK